MSMVEMAASDSYSRQNCRSSIEEMRERIEGIPVSCWLVLLAAVLAPMTALRVWKAGPAESACLLGCVIYFVQDCNWKLPTNEFTEFWAVFLSISFLGSFYCSIFYPNEHTSFGMLTWCYFAFISTIVFEMFSKSDNVQILILLTSFASTIWYGFLYIFSKTVSTSFFGASLWYHNVRYTGGGLNPHQVALLMAVASVSLFASALNERRLVNKIIMFATAYGAAMLLNETRSSTGQMAMWLGYAFAVYRRIPSSHIRCITICIILIIVAIQHEYLLTRFFNWIASDSNGIGRLEIYSTFPEAFDKSPLIGLGPGHHVRGGVTEFHNTYLEVWAMSGTLGMLAFAAFSFWTLNKVVKNPVSLAVFVALYAYGFSGFGMRRLVYWLLLAMAITVGDASTIQADHSKASRKLIIGG